MGKQVYENTKEKMLNVNIATLFVQAVAILYILLIQLLETRL
jgi:hypothetical protein